MGVKEPNGRLGIFRVLRYNGRLGIFAVLGILAVSRAWGGRKALNKLSNGCQKVVKQVSKAIKGETYRPGRSSVKLRAVKKAVKTLTRF